MATDGLASRAGRCPSRGGAPPRGGGGGGGGGAGWGGGGVGGGRGAGGGAGGGRGCRAGPRGGVGLGGHFGAPILRVTRPLTVRATFSRAARRSARSGLGARSGRTKRRAH